MPQKVYDLRSFFIALGGVQSFKAGVQGTERVLTKSSIDIYDPSPALISCPPLDVSGYVDGIQASSCIKYIQHRPLHLIYVAAARMSPKLIPLQVEEYLQLLCSRQDAVGLAALSQGIEVVAMDSTIPQELESLAARYVDNKRRKCEQVVVAGVPGPVVVDGDLREYSSNLGLVGVTKTLRTKYLPNENSLIDLPVGWRSEAFKISNFNNTDRYSCYLRLLDSTSQSWSFGLIRLETYRPQWLEPLASLCLTQRQIATSSDKRYDTHLAPIRACEELLRSRQPTAFSYL